LLIAAGVVGCALTYQDINVTSALKVGRQVRVCNGDWSSFAEFEKVAFINGSILAKADMEEPQAMGLLQALRSVDSTITADWALPYSKCSTSFTGIPIRTTNNKKMQWRSNCNSTSSSGRRVVNVDGFSLQEVKTAFALTVTEGLWLLPSMNTELLAALFSLRHLVFLQLDVGSGALSPQLAVLTNPHYIGIRYYCLRGPFPTNLVSSLYDLHTIQVGPKEHVVRASDPASGLCGLNGTATHLIHSDTYPSLSYLNLCNNQITIQLPPHLLSLANFVNMTNNKNMPIDAGAPRVECTRLGVDLRLLAGQGGYVHI
jgi:hypothetical protein